jgi:UDP-N-acetylmuramyl pentapeptide phosphotransferase/UDP-N-acetylglucosamine-1-phosphate transferase
LKALAIGFLSLILTCITMLLVRWAAIRWGFVDRPDGPLKPQTRAIPYGGGIAIAVGVSIVLSWARPGLPVIPVIGAMMVLLLGIVDDAVDVRPQGRLVVGLLAGSTLLVLWPFAVSQWSSAVLAGACCAVLASASMNAYNMTDGSDGLSGTVGLFAAGGLLVGWLLAGETVLMSIAAASCGSIVGFLIFNWPPARVYLGDAGAYWMGFLLTALCIPALSSLHAVVGVMCIMALLEVELLASVLRRIREHQGLTGGDRGHIYDVLHLRLGQSATRIDVLYGFIGLISSGIGILVWRGAPTILGLTWLAVLSVLVALLYRWSRPEKGVVR